VPFYCVSSCADSVLRGSLPPPLICIWPLHARNFPSMSPQLVLLLVSLPFVGTKPHSHFFRACPLRAPGTTFLVSLLHLRSISPRFDSLLPQGLFHAVDTYLPFSFNGIFCPLGRGFFTTFPLFQFVFSPSNAWGFFFSTSMLLIYCHTPQPRVRVIGPSLGCRS